MAAFPLFGHLDEPALFLYDEQRLATNALEISNSGNWLLTTYDGTPDYLNTKPPLMVWLQVLSMALLGTTELAVRLPSALAAMATCLVLYTFCWRRFRSPFLGFLSAVVLVTAKGYVDIHGTRTGDYDALLTLFTTSYCLSWFSFLEDEKRSQLYLFFLMLMLAVLTKCTAACLMLPALFLYTIIQGKLLKVLRNPHSFIGLFIVIVPAAAWYIARQQIDPGYLSAVWKMDIGGRYNEVLSFVYGPEYYLSLLAKSHFVPWLAISVVGAVIAFSAKDRQLRRLSISLCTTLLVFIGVLSFSATKFYWYVLPAYPLLSLLAAVSLHWFLKSIASTSFAKKIPSAIQALFVLLLLAWPYSNTIDRTFNARLYHPSQENMTMGLFMKDVLHGHRQLDSHVIALDGRDGNIRWYLKALAKKGIAISVNEDKSFKVGDKVVAFQAELQEYIQTHFETKLVEDFRGVHVYELVQTKDI